MYNLNFYLILIGWKLKYSTKKSPTQSVEASKTNYSLYTSNNNIIIEHKLKHTLINVINMKTCF